ncbi:bifunctional phosphoribosylaminoimidazolecarboxamide formyltransferase/IMP cyclohydrolase [Anaerovorax sp. IOR16]|uniref:bifunctional phosphoribosylaminoimidazolecarboxamide formyltransferase/IMP cyclohydrolase n=1 Tax=Anaerovorax sp. IOR16 TaxID=2773458 RepID=UPI0019D1AE72|nr:bifunctional phosphoribosylaminoimidazolecarboxamide formyltransferase/IMP cyclohydrolase [Anaerovorax sp. IOR16]
MRALISVSDKTGVVEFAQKLEELGVQIISTGGTATRLKENGIAVTGISEVTGFPECLDGRVKTLHPAVHGGILAMREKTEHMQQLKDLNIETIDIVAINLYPFKQTILKEDVTLEEAIENIDIGGPTMLRSAAKNHKDVVVVCDPQDYEAVVVELKENGTVSYDTKYKLALKVFEHTASYDALISDYLRKQIHGELPNQLTLTFEKAQELRYGENPHQKAWYYKEIKPQAGDLVNAKQLHGKELSFNNINDTNGALEALKEFEQPTVVAVKHANPCGVGVGETICDAYVKAYDADPVSIYGGIIAANRPIDEATALEISKIFVEIIIAPDFTEKALEVLTQKKNLRLLKLPAIIETISEGTLTLKKVTGGLLVQEIDTTLFEEDDLKVVTDRIPTEQEMADMCFAMKVVKHIKSNGIVIAKDNRTLGIGPGQVNRIWAVENSIKQATGDTKGAVLASDAYFPFDDCVQAAAAAGITAIIQPGGSIRDEESIKKANELGIAMVFTGVRHFKH